MFRRTTPARLCLYGLLAALCAPTSPPASGQSPPETAGRDWPTFRGDRARSGRTAESLRAAHLVPAWTHQAPQRPRPAWPGPARWDAFAKLPGLKSMRDYDPVSFPVIAGGTVYFGSSADDSVTKLDARTGELVWRFVSGGPVRVAPEVTGGRVYFGSDDGAAYCLDAASGALVWRNDPTAGAAGSGAPSRVLHDGRLVSRWPVRSGVLVDDGVAYFTASMLPWNPSYVCAVDAADGTYGSPVANGGTGPARPTFVRELGRGYTMEGALLATATRLVVPQGRVAPLLFDRASGESSGVLAGGGGSFVLLTEDERVLHGPGNKTGWITDSSAGTREVIASYERGNAIVVGADASYLLSDRTLAALARDDRRLLWSVPTATPYALVLAGDVLFAGGADRVDARAASDGRLLWSAPVEGEAHGIAIARGRLFVATDAGRLHVFHEGEEPVALSAALAASEAEAGAATALRPPPPVQARAPRGLIDRWVFQSDTLEHRALDASDPRTSAFVRNQVEGRPDARVLGAAQIRQAGDVHAFVLDGRGSDLEVLPSFHAVELPQKTITVEAWVRVDKPLEWGGLASVMQDNGEYERGWLLGFRQKRFGFALAATGGPGRLTWLLAEGEYQPETWHHVVGTYDGSEQRIFVDGALAASARVQSGAMAYPDDAFYHLGAYRDADEYFRVTGALHEICVYDRALSGREVARRHAAKAKAFPVPAPPAPERALTTLAAGPILRFVAPGEALVTWETANRVPTALVHESGSGEPAVLGAGGRRRRHEVRLTGLEPETVTTFRIRVERTGGTLETRDHECDTHFDFHERPTVLSEFPGPVARAPQWGDPLRAAMDPGPALCVVLGASGEGALARELARSSGVRVLVVTSDLEAARTLRERFVAQGRYGSSVAVHTVGADPLAPLDLPSAFADLVVLDPSALEEARVLLGRGAAACVQPDGGLLALPADAADAAAGLLADGDFVAAPGAAPASIWTLLERTPLSGAGAWTHMYGRPDNSAFGGEALGGARSTADLIVQWIGRPGPRYQSDRQNRKPAPLGAGGRLFMQGLGRVIAADAYNGTPLWAVELPELRRFNIPRTSSNWCTDGEALFLAMGDRVWKLDAATGALLEHLTVEAPRGADAGAFEWGYVARRGGSLIGSAVRAGSQFTEFWGSESWYDGKDGQPAAKVCSEVLFSLDARGRVEWRRSVGLVVESTITVTDDRVFFVEARGDAARAEGRVSGRIGDALWEELFLVALDAETGRVAWERPARPTPGKVAFYLAHSDGRLVMLSSDAGAFALYAFDAQDGKSLWRKKFPWEVDHHGKHLSRPAIVQGKVFVRPLVFELETGDELPSPFPEGHQCGTYVCAENAVILRAGELCVWDPEERTSSRWSRLRPDCWISSIPACGMLLAPEGGGGCSCGSWMEASMGFLPRAR